MARIRCFWLEETDRVRVWLRRYSTPNDPNSPCFKTPGFHSAMVLVGEMAAVFGEGGPAGKKHLSPPMPIPPDSDPRWPVTCERCGYVFSDEDSRQVFQRTLMRRTDTGEIITREEAPSGAMWDAWWYRQHGDSFSFWQPVEGINLIVKTPGGEWYIDGCASNCDQPDRPHRCWIRHGTVPDITVDKNGDTCGAGAGSIQSGSYHGFLRAGYLED